MFSIKLNLGVQKVTVFDGFQLHYGRCDWTAVLLEFCGLGGTATGSCKSRLQLKILTKFSKISASFSGPAMSWYSWV